MCSRISDSMSDIKKVKFGLGLTRYDEDVMEFQDYYNRSMLWIPASMLPVGKYMYGRLRAVNNGESFLFSLIYLASSHSVFNCQSIST